MAEQVKRVLVTGANGFVGRHLLQYLSERAIPFVAASRTGEAVDGNATIAVGAVNEDTDWSAALHGVSHVIHLAGRAHILKETETDPDAAFHRVNAMGTRTLAAQAAAKGVQHFVYVSSIAVYHTALTHLAAATREDPQTPYGRSKLAGETALRDQAGDAMRWTILRPPLVYGPGVRANFGHLLKLASLRMPLPLGRVRNRRSFIYVHNLADALVRVLDHPAAADRIFLVSDGRDISTPDLVRTLATAMGRQPLFLPLPGAFLDLGATLIGQGARWRKLTGTLTIDSTDFQNSLGWYPPVALNDGLAETGKWFARSRLN